MIRITPALLALLVIPAFGQAPGEQVESGRRLFQEACSSCHGQTGKGGHGPSLVDSRRVREMDETRMLDVIQNGIKGTTMPASTLPRDQAVSIVAFVRDLNAPAIGTRVPGDPAAGRTLYLGKAGCVRCHAIAGEGGSIAPDLTNIGALRTSAQLRESIVDPDRKIAPDYQGATVRTQDGKSLEGVARNYDSYSVQMIDKQGKLHLLRRADLADFRLIDHSLMPRDYSARLTPAEIDNLVAWLSRQSLRPKDPPSSQPLARKDQR